MIKACPKNGLFALMVPNTARRTLRLSVSGKRRADYSRPMKRAGPMSMFGQQRGKFRDCLLWHQTWKPQDDRQNLPCKSRVAASTRFWLRRFGPIEKAFSDFLALHCSYCYRQYAAN